VKNGLLADPRLELRLGRAILSVAVCAFGVQFLLYGNLLPGLFLPQNWTAPGPLFARLLGAFFIGSSVSLFLPSRAALAFSIVTAVSIILVNYAHPLDVLFVGIARIRFFEPLAIAAAALVLAVAVDRDIWFGPTLDRIGRYTFAFCLLMFGLQHFLYPYDVAQRIPWVIPAHIVFVYITGAAFVAAGIAIATGIQSKLAGEMLALMFLIFLVVLHLPDCVADPANGLKWASFFVALAMCASGLIIGATPLP